MFSVESKHNSLIWRSLVVAVFVVATLVVVTARAADGGPDGLLHVSVLDIGQGDAIFIQAPNGRTVLVDGGPDQSVLNKLGDLLGPQNRTIDVMVVSHWHTDHIAGLIEVAQRYTIGRFVSSRATYDSASARELRRVITDREIPFVEATAGQVFDLGGDTTLTVVYPFESFASMSGEIKNAHDANVTMILRHGQATVLLAGDMEKSGEDALRQAGIAIDTDILKVGHHGSKTSSSQQFLDAVTPAAALISVGARNTYHHPTTEILTRLDQSRIPYYRTDTQGDLMITTDGEYINLTHTK